MAYYKKVNFANTIYYNTSTSKMIIETGSPAKYEVLGADHDATWLAANATSINQSEFDDKANGASEWARLGTHPPCPPGGCQ